MRGGLCIQAAAPRMPAPPPVPRRRSGPPTEPHHRSKPGATAAQPEAEKARAYQRAFDDLVRQNVMSKYLFIKCSWPSRARAHAGSGEEVVLAHGGGA